MVTCDGEFAEDENLKAKETLPWTMVPFPRNKIQTANLATAVPEKCETRQFAISTDHEPSRPTNVAPSQNLNDLDNFVGS